MKPKHVLVGIAGGIAAYKACSLVSALTKQGCEVRVVMTDHAARFVSPLTLAALCGHEVYTDEFDGKTPEAMIPHIHLAGWADVLIIAPCTANVLAKAVCGIADDLLTSIIPAAVCPKLMAPAMNVHMYENIVTQQNLQKAKEQGWILIEPAEGHLACGTSGKGRLPENEVLLKAVNDVLDAAGKAADPAKDTAAESGLLAGKTVLVSAGPTIEHLDPVRYLTNRSSGKQGYAIAKAAKDMGARVILVSGPVNPFTVEGIERIEVESALQMQQAMEQHARDADFVIMAAAVADYRPAVVHEQKKKKGAQSEMIEFVRNPDILARLGKNKKPGQILCGFAMETENLDANAKAKLESKNCDLLIANNLTTSGAGFQTDTNVVSLLLPDEIRHLDQMSKEDLGRLILKTMLSLQKGAL